MENDPHYKVYRKDRKIRQVVQTVLETTGIDLSNGAGIHELVRFQKHFRQYKIVVYRGLSCEDIMFEGQVDSPKKTPYTLRRGRTTLSRHSEPNQCHGQRLRVYRMQQRV